MLIHCNMKVVRDLADCLLPRLELLHGRLIDQSLERDGDREEGDVDKAGVLGDLALGRKLKGLLKGCGGEIDRGKGRVTDEEP
jgi:hypothetical protein